MNEIKNKPDYFSVEWFNALLSEIAATNVTQVALKMGVSRPTLSIFINGKGQYGNGKASPANMEIRYRQAFEQLTCPHTNALVGVKHCRETALRIAPTHNPLQMVQWQACQDCKFKPAPIAQVEVPKQAKAAKAVPTSFSMGKASTPFEAETEGYESIGGPTDNPYPVEDQRHDYWEAGYKQRRELDRKQKERFNSKIQEPVQQAGIIDKVTLPLPEVGAPQIADQTNQEAA